MHYRIVFQYGQWYVMSRHDQSDYWNTLAQHVRFEDAVQDVHYKTGQPVTVPLIIEHV